MKILSATCLLIVLSVTIAAKPKTGQVVVTSNVPVQVLVGPPAPNAVVVTRERWELTELPVGDYTFTLIFPDGQIQTQTVRVRANCTTPIYARFTPAPEPPKCPPPPPAKVETRVEEKKVEVPVYVMPFDVCCECKRDELKARLDVFAIELQRDPSNRGRIVAADDFAVDYLVKYRLIDRSRLIFIKSKGGLRNGKGQLYYPDDAAECLQLWVVLP